MMNSPQELLVGSASLVVRPQVIIQLIVAWLPIMLTVAIRKRLSSTQQVRKIQQAALASSGILIGLLALLGQPVGLAVLCWALILGHSLCWLTEQALSLILTNEARHRLNKRLINPAYILGCSLIIIDQFVSLEQLFSTPLGKFFGAEMTIGSAGWALLTLYLLIIGSAPIGFWLAQGLQEVFEFDEGSLRANALIFHYALMFLGVILVLNGLGLNQNAFWAIAGGLSLGIGFGIREVIANLISGVWLLFEGSVRPGEVLYLDGFPCEVRSLGLRATVLWRDGDNAEIVVPNQTFFTSPSVSYSALQRGTSRLRRSEVIVSADYRHPPAMIVALLESIAAMTEGVLPEPSPKGFVLDYGESGVSYGVKFFIQHPMENGAISSLVRIRIWDAFAERDICIPFPQRVLHGAMDQRQPARNAST